MSDIGDLFSVADLARRSQQRVDDLLPSSGNARKQGVSNQRVEIERLLREPRTALTWVRRRWGLGDALPESAALESENGIHVPVPVELLDEHPPAQRSVKEPAAVKNDKPRLETVSSAEPAVDTVHHPRVMISYTHDSPEHMGETRALADRLRSEGVDCIIDQYEESPAQGWPRWMTDQIEEAEWVLVVCTETYNKRVRGHEVPGKGLGASWEGAIIMQEVYEEQVKTNRFIPVVFDPKDAVHRPTFLKSLTYYALRDEEHYERLYRRLTGQPKIVKPELGPLRAMPPAEPRTQFRSIERKTPSAE